MGAAHRGGRTSALGARRTDQAATQGGRLVPERAPRTHRHRQPTRQSLRQNGRITPSVDALIRVAEALDTSIDYLLIDDAPRRPLHSPDADLAARLGDLAQLSEADCTSLLHMLDALITKSRLKTLPGER